MALINQPPTTPLIQGAAWPGWATFLNQAYVLLSGLTQSGSTVDRPIKGLYVGRPYWDSTIGIPIWFNGITWVDSTGNPV